MFNFGPCVENVTDLKVKLSSLYHHSMVLLSMGQHLIFWPATWMDYSDRAKVASKIRQVNHIFYSFDDFRDFLEKHFMGYIMGISKHIPNAIRQYQTLFYFIVITCSDTSEM